MKASPILKSIGRTPLIQLDGIWIKCEWRNPSGSIKDRVAIHLVEHAESQGLIRPGDRLVEGQVEIWGMPLRLLPLQKDIACWL